MDKKILLTNIYKNEPLSIISANIPKGFSLIMPEELSQESLADRAGEADYILASGRIRIDNGILSRAKKLKMIQRTGVGLDGIDLKFLKERQIPLYVNQGINSQSVAEHTLMLILSCLRNLIVIDRNTKKGIWKKQEQGVRTHELHGKTIGVIGLGNIGKCLIRLLKGFEVNILYYDTERKDPFFERDNEIQYADKETLFRESDLITLHCALTDQTEKIINFDSIDKMKDGAIIINTARGRLIDERALVEALESGKIAFAGLDVYEKEPMEKGNILQSLDNVILTPHVAGITYESFDAMMNKAMNNIRAFENGDLELIREYRYI